MLTQLRPALASFAMLTIIAGVIYPAIVTGIARVAFPRQAAGSVIKRDGTPIGSSLIAQPFTDARYFWPRPSAANYDAANGAGSNLGPSNPALYAAVKTRVDTLHAVDVGSNLDAVPAELVTASASGLDPHISPESAERQVSRVARARGQSEADIRMIVVAHTNARTFGILGEPRVNVLELNLALDRPAVATQTVAAATLPTTLGWRWRGFASDDH